MLTESKIGTLVTVMVFSTAVLSACGMIDLPCLLGDCPTADKCGNGALDPGETCDIAIAAGQPGACPTSCDDGNACTTDMLQNAGSCLAACQHTPITTCLSGDGCCPQGAGCNNNTDSDCPPVCGNSIIEVGEMCDPPDQGVLCGCFCAQDCMDICSECSYLVGTWISHVKTAGTITAPSPIGTLTGATIDVVQRIVVTQSVPGFIDFRLDICSLSTTATGSFPFSVDYSPAVIATLTTTGSTPFQIESVGDVVAFPSFTINTGWNGVYTCCLNNPTCPTCPIPGSAYPPITTLPLECCGAVDTDGDGNYAITLPIHLFNGALNLWAYAGLTMNISMANMVLTDSNTMTGTTSFPITGYIFGSTAGATGVLNVVPDSDAVPITMIKLDGDIPCSEVLTHCTGATCIP